MKKEYHLLWIVMAVIAVFIIWEVAKPGSEEVTTAIADDPMLSNVQTPGNATNGPAYLLFNSPYAFSPPVQNFLPRTSSGQVGQVVDTNTGCQTCGG